MFIAGDLATVQKQIDSNPPLKALVEKWQRESPINLTYETPITTDDWPYIYLEKRRIPVLYYVLAGLMILLFLYSAKVFKTEGLASRWKRGHWHFFFLGSAFLLLEVQNISKAGVALGNWINNTWNGKFDRLAILEEPRVGALPAARLLGQIDGLEEVVGEIVPAKKVYLDSGNTSEQSRVETLKALRDLPNEDRIAVVTINDDAAVGALAAARDLRREADVVIVGQGADRIARGEIRHPDSRIIGSTAYWPERYGEKLIPLAMKILQGEAVPPAVHIDHEFIDARNIDAFYPA